MVDPNLHRRTFGELLCEFFVSALADGLSSESV